MKKLLILVLVLGSAVAFTVWALEDPGYVIIGRGVWALETTLSLLVWVLAIGGLILYVILKFINYLWQFPSTLLATCAQKKQQKAYLAVEKGLNALLCGHWQEAERLFAKHLTTHLTHYVGAAYSAQQQAQFEHAVTYLEQARENGLEEKLALALLQTQLYLQQNNLLSALKSAMYAKILAPDEKAVLWLLFIIQLQLANWTAVLELLPTLRKHKLLSPVQVQQLQERATHLQQDKGITKKSREQ
jgi:HemY protein